MKILIVLLCVSFSHDPILLSTSLAAPSLLRQDTVPSAAFFRKFWEEILRHREHEGAFSEWYPDSVRNFVLGNIRTTLGYWGRRRIVDLGAGGDLWLAREIKKTFPYVEMHTLDIIPVDQSQSDPWEIQCKVASAENTGYEIESFDIVVSTYTLDYTEVKQSLKELYRILKPNGKGILVLHHPDSDVIARLRKAWKNAIDMKVFFTQLKAQIEAENFNIQPLLASIQIANMNNSEEKAKLLFLQKTAHLTKDPSGKDSLLRAIEDVLLIYDSELYALGQLFANLFMTVEEVRESFVERGFRTWVQVLGDSSPIGYGVIVEKIRDEALIFRSM